MISFSNYSTYWNLFAGNKCYGIDPFAREDCGYYGIQRDECENDKGCCYDSSVQDVPWCFKGAEPEPGFGEEEGSTSA